MSDLFPKVKKFLQENNLKPLDAVDESSLVDDKRFLIISCLDKVGKKWLFKIQYLDAPQIGGNFLNEVNFLKLADRYKEIVDWVPLIADFGWLLGKIWYLREFIDGQILGKDEDTFPYDSDILSKLDSMKVARFFYNLAKIPLSEVLHDIPGIKRYDSKWYNLDQKLLKNHPAVLKLQAQKTDYFIKEEQKRLFNLFLKPPQNVLLPSSWALSHANLSPTNIIFKKPRNLIFIDWENICWGFKTSSFAEFWYRCLKLPAFQDELFQSRLKLEEEKEDFLRVFYFSLMVMAFSTTPMLPENSGLIEYLIKHYNKGKIEKKVYEQAAEILTKTVRQGMEVLKV